MKIAIDMQGAQSESRFRGIGRYTMSIALAMAKNDNQHEIFLILNSSFPESIMDIRKTFEDFIPQERIQVFEVPLPVAQLDPENGTRQRSAELIREYFMAQLKPDMVFIPSLFEGFVDNAVSSIDLFSKMKTAVALHDLIPLKHKKVYLSDKRHREYYFNKIEYFKKADMYLSVSHNSKKEAIDLLGIPEEKIVVIPNSVDGRFREMALTKKEREKLCSKYSIDRKIVMYAPGGFDSRKNFEGIMKAFTLMPKHLRDEYQLVIVSNIRPEEEDELLNISHRVKLSEDELVLTGYVPDEDLVALYNMAELFVFPSKHEGFGLPVLEAMSCGTPVVGSNISSIPEVIGWKEALFDPESPEDMANKIERVLTDEKFKKSLIEHGYKQKKTFSWKASAIKALANMEKYNNLSKNRISIDKNSNRKPKLAYFSPLPPIKSGISDYSAKLLPFLSEYYDITLIVDQKPVDELAFPIHAKEWFLTHAEEFDRILYQFGNSPYHSHMRSVLDRYPGIVIMHDFFISGMLYYEQMSEGKENEWIDALFNSHGYWALEEYFDTDGMEKCKMKYPCNKELIENAKGIITHSIHPKKMAEYWYKGVCLHWCIVPILQSAADTISKNRAKELLTFQGNDFIVCSFGFIDTTKMNDRLVDAWNSSKFIHVDNAKLVFVGEYFDNEFSTELLEKIKNSPRSENIIITGWTENTRYKLYLEAADIAVQLRTQSRGETSASVLDCMSYGLPTIVNASGTMNDLPEGSVYKLPENFTDSELVDILEKLYDDEAYRLNLGNSAKKMIRTKHDPASCARQYMNAIEESYNAPKANLFDLFTTISTDAKPGRGGFELLTTAKSIAQSSLSQVGQKQLFVDVSSIARKDLKTGIERVVRAQLLELLESPPAGFRVEPVYLTNDDGWHYKYARSYTCNLLNIDYDLDDAPIDLSNGDIFYGLDYNPYDTVEAVDDGIYRKMKIFGVYISFSVYDLLPLSHPHFFPETSEAVHSQWLKSISSVSDQLICISESVADELKNWLGVDVNILRTDLEISALHLGADLDASSPSRGLKEDSKNILTKLGSKASFLMVGTIEPRKGYLQTISAFEELWGRGLDIQLVIVGKEGWAGLEDSQRRTIPEIIDKIKTHPLLGIKLFWLEGISDEYLEKVYAESTCLIASSEGEGFGLPLIEAAQKKIPIIARDIPVFQEVAGEHAYYFSDDQNPQVIADAITSWLELYRESKNPISTDMPWITWEESTRQLLKCLYIDNDRDRIDI